MRHNNRRGTFSLEEELWIKDSYFYQKRWFKVNLDGFVSYKHATFPFTRLIDGLEWCGLLIVMFYQLFILHL